MKSMLKSELACLAGVSDSTFKRWLGQHRDTLATFGLTPRCKIVPPRAVRFICDWYGIDID